MIKLYCVRLFPFAIVLFLLSICLSAFKHIQIIGPSSFLLGIFNIFLFFLSTRFTLHFYLSICFSLHFPFFLLLLVFLKVCPFTFLILTDRQMHMLGILNGNASVKDDNQSPKGIKWSAVPLPCSTCVCIDIFCTEGSRAAAPIGDEVL